ncbi:helix-turn-helix transcriptional regulator [Effusibacillus consociatus]|uniref:Helix-turn-helix transcriptional regulator n=1 Tax=Effusibacillus consociatus TaxID=1117041 RepID=A0ABV9Q7T0_9BACL
MRKINLSYIANRRNELNKTLQDLADALGFKNASTYMKYEKGDYAFKADHLPILAREINCSIDDLFFEKNFADLAKYDEQSATSA